MCLLSIICYAGYKNYKFHFTQMANFARFKIYDNFEFGKKVVPCSIFLMSFKHDTQIYAFHIHNL